MESMTKRDAKGRKVLDAKENTTKKGTIECDSSLSTKKRAKDSAPQKIAPLVIKDKKLKKD